MCRRNRSNAAGVAPRLPARSEKSGAVIEASGVADSSVNGADDPGLPPVDHGSTRNSTVSGDVLAANVTQPESVAGSMEVYAATASEIWVPCAPQEGRLPGPDESLVHALANRQANTAGIVIRAIDAIAQAP